MEETYLNTLPEFLDDELDDELLSSYTQFSSEDEELEDVEIIFNQTLHSRHCIPNYMEIVAGYSEEEFITNFRLCREKFGILASQFCNSEVYQNLLRNPSSRLQIDERKSLCMFLWFAGHRVGYREIKDKFNASLSSVHDIITRVTLFLSGRAKDFIKLPSNEEMDETAQYFMENKGFPNVFGCIDGSHIKIDQPTERSVDYFNRKDYYSMNIQAVCNAKKKFIDIFIGFPGSVHDARVFRNSSLFSKLPNICQNGKCLLGDSAYPLLNYLLVPYRDNGHLNEAQKLFNKRLSSCRIFIEHTFGILKERFPQLYHVRLRGHKRICHFIRACMALHNFCNDDSIFTECEYRDDSQPDEMPTEESEMPGQILRDIVTEQLMQ